MLCFSLTKQRINPSEWATVRILWVRIDNSCQCLISLIKVDPTQYVTKCIFTGRNTSAHDAYVLILLSPLKKINPFWWTSISNGSRSCLPIVRKHNFCSYLPLDPLWAPTLGKFWGSKQIFGPSFLLFFFLDQDLWYSLFTVASELLILSLDLVKNRVGVMSLEMRKSFIGQILVGLIEKTSDPKVMKAITKMVEDWVKTKV